MNGERKIFRCAIIFAILRTIVVCADSHLNSDSVSEILKFWKEQEDQLILGTQKNVVIFLGDTGSGKSSVISLLTGVELESVETNIGTGAFQILDTLGRITRMSTVISQTLVPELVVDKDSGVAYFDCPGFKDTRGVKYDITITYLIRKLLEFTDSVKLMFVISHSSVSTGGDRHGILELAKHANNLIKNIDKFSDAIGLVVTKVENRRIEENGEFVLVNDEKIIEGIQMFLQQAEEDLKGLNNKEDTPSYDRKINEMAIKFINILLKKGRDGQPRIAIFRKPFEAGSIGNMPIFENEKNSIKRQINQNLKFIHKASGDFGYALSVESKVRATELINELQMRLISNILAVGDGIVTHYTQQGAEYFDLDLLHTQAFAIDQVLIRTFDEDPYVFLERFVETVKTTNVTGITENIETIEKYIEHHEFLSNVTESSTLNPQQIADGLIKAIRNVGNLQKWYDFLIDLYETISEMNLKAKRLSYDRIKSDARDLMEKWSNVGETQKTNVNEIGMQQFLDGIDIKMNYGIETMPINGFQLRALKAVLNVAINDKLTCSSDGATISGFNVKMSDIIEMKCWQGSSAIEIFALDKILFDVDFERSSDGNPEQLSIVAPVWKVMGNRRINLNGQSALNFQSSAADGNSYHIDGWNGAPGKSGTSAASLFGIGNKFMGDSMLSIQANGGNAGSGQDGGQGYHSQLEKAPIIGLGALLGAVLGSLLTGPVVIPVLAAAASGGGLGAIGSASLDKIGAGGTGGAAGLTGSCGDIRIIGLDEKPQFSIGNLNGAIGKPGKGGYSVDNSRRGRDGANANRVSHSISATNISTQQMSQIIIKYNDFIETNMANYIRQTALKNFTAQMKHHKIVEQHNEIIHDEM